MFPDPSTFAGNRTKKMYLLSLLRKRSEEEVVIDWIRKRRTGKEIFRTAEWNQKHKEADTIAIHAIKSSKNSGSVRAEQ